jgi:hypothetical protein
MRSGTPQRLPDRTGPETGNWATTAGSSATSCQFGQDSSECLLPIRSPWEALQSFREKGLDRGGEEVGTELPGLPEIVVTAVDGDHDARVLLRQIPHLALEAIDPAIMAPERAHLADPFGVLDPAALFQRPGFEPGFLRRGLQQRALVELPSIVLQNRPRGQKRRLVRRGPTMRRPHHARSAADRWPR